MVCCMSLIQLCKAHIKFILAAPLFTGGCHIRWWTLLQKMSFLTQPFQRFVSPFNQGSFYQNHYSSNNHISDRMLKHNHSHKAEVAKGIQQIHSKISIQLKVCFQFKIPLILNQKLQLYPTVLKDTKIMLFQVVAHKTINISLTLSRIWVKVIAVCKFH